jgi:hypothetical protein
MLCRDTSSYTWAKIGFAVYSFLPIAFFNATLSLSNKKLLLWTYTFPLFFSFLALFYPGFITETTCKIFHVSVNSLVFRENVVALTGYLVFYSFFIIKGVLIYLKNGVNIYKDTLKIRIGVSIVALSQLLGILFFFLYNFLYGSTTKSSFLLLIIFTTFLIILVNIIIIFFIKNYKKFIKYASILLILTFLIEFTLFILSWQFSYDFASIWCHFAFLYSIACIIFARISLNDKK